MHFYNRQQYTNLNTPSSIGQPPQARALLVLQAVTCFQDSEYVYLLVRVGYNVQPRPSTSCLEVTPTELHPGPWLRQQDQSRLTENPYSHVIYQCKIHKNFSAI